MGSLSPATDLARRLAQNTESVCRYYLSNGGRQGGYWLVGDVANQPGRSLFVRLKGPDHGKGAAGKWTDAATGEHGDLLDLIALNRGLNRLRDVFDEARAFLSLPKPEPGSVIPRPGHPLPTARRNWPAVCSPCRARLPAPWPRLICADAASRRSRICRTALPSALLLPRR